MSEYFTVRFGDTAKTIVAEGRQAAMAMMSHHLENRCHLSADSKRRAVDFLEMKQDFFHGFFGESVCLLPDTNWLGGRVFSVFIDPCTLAFKEIK